jgi:glyoxylase-like metal-dependent hydrolase (beta-lactamase superfamily II)
LVFQKVTENVFAIVGRPALANVAAFILPEKVVLANCGIQLSAVKETRKEIEQIAGKKINTVILSHFHTDHTGGLPAFHDCKIISSNLLLKNLKLANRKTPGGFKQTFPNEIFSKQLEFKEDGIKLIIKHTGGHTDCSTYVFCPNYRAIAAGDNLWTQYYPWGGARGCDPDVWAQTLKEYLTLDAEHFIPGHGPVGEKKSVTALLNYLDNVSNVMKKMIALGKNEADVLKRGGKVEYPLSGGGQAHISTLKKWYKIWQARQNI